MHDKDYRDIIGGGAAMALGAFTAIYATISLDLGTVWRMGPGMFPAALGVILFVLGLAILIPALFRARGEYLPTDARSFVVVTASILFFAMVVRPFGLIPATFGLVLIASRADGKLSLLKTVILATAVSVGATLVFRVGFGLRLPIINWPW